MEIICKNQKFGHDFPYTGANCTNCKVNQDHIGTVTKKVVEKPVDYMDKLKERAKKKEQATYHQHLAVETAEMLGDIKSIGIYMRLFKRYDHNTIFRCRDWAIEKGTGKNKGKLFLSVFHRKFIDSKPSKEYNVVN